MQLILPRILVLFTLLLVNAGAAEEFYIAPNGSDANPGTKSKPFATVERARDAGRKLRQGQKAAGSNINIVIRGGDYLRTNALELTAADSGTAESPVIWQAMEGEHARLLGGRKLAGFQRVIDREVLSRLAKTAQDHVVQLNLRSLGITNFGEMKSRGFARPLSAAHCELFYDGKPMTLARWPNEGEWEHIAGFPKASGQDDGHHGNIGKLEGGFLYSGDRPQRWKDTRNLWVHGYWAWDWANSYERVALLDLERRFIQTAAPYGNYGFRQGQRFYFLNILEELDQPGEWFLDPAAGILYLWPPQNGGGGTRSTASADSSQKVTDAVERAPPGPLTSTATSSEHEILLSLLGEPFLKLTGVSNVVFRGVTLEATRGSAVEIRNGGSNRIADCVIRNIGDSGVTIEGGYGHGVAGCDIFDTGDGGVALRGGDRQTLDPAGHFVEDCRFARQGRWSKCYVPAVLMEGVGLRASHNLIQDHPHCAILFSGNDNLIEFNEIHHIALETGDVGAIYAGRDYTYRGNRIRHNFIHHTGGVGMGSMGVYMDDCVSGAEISGNVFYKVQRAAFLGGGRDHQVLNNIFVECNHAVELDGRGLDSSPTWREMVDQTMRQGLAAIPQPLYRARYPEIKTLDKYFGPPEGPPIKDASFTGVPPENNVVTRNICVGKWLNVYWHASPEMLRLENNLTNADPRFVETPPDKSSAKAFALKSDSPAWSLGFEKIPVEGIGPRIRGR